MHQTVLLLDKATARRLELLAEEEETSIHALTAALIYAEAVALDFTSRLQNIRRSDIARYVFPKNPEVIPVVIEIGIIQEQNLGKIAYRYTITAGKAITVEQTIALLTAELDKARHKKRSPKERFDCSLPHCFVKTHPEEKHFS